MSLQRRWRTVWKYDRLAGELPRTVLAFHAGNE
jgi:hypothetical protein